MSKTNLFKCIILIIIGTTIVFIKTHNGNYKVYDNNNVYAYDKTINTQNYDVYYSTNKKPGEDIVKELTIMYNNYILNRIK